MLVHVRLHKHLIVPIAKHVLCAFKSCARPSTWQDVHTCPSGSACLLRWLILVCCPWISCHSCQVIVMTNHHFNVVGHLVRSAFTHKCFPFPLSFVSRFKNHDVLDLASLFHDWLPIVLYLICTWLDKFWHFQRLLVGHIQFVLDWQVWGATKNLLVSHVAFDI